MNVIKRDGRVVDYDPKKIEVAVGHAMQYGSGIFNKEAINEVIEEIDNVIKVTKSLTIFQIEDMIYHKLTELGEVETAKAYEGYRAIQEFKRTENSADDGIIGLLNHTNLDVMNENSNKNPILISTQRDLIAGEVSKDMAMRKIIPGRLVQAHKRGLIHIHDLDYFIQPMFNCCLIDIDDMLKNGTIINGKMVETPKSFQVACTVTTQIVAQVASNQYGGQSLNKIDTVLAPYARKSYDKAYKRHRERLNGKCEHGYQEELLADQYADEDMRQEIKEGIQTIQYQINTLMTTNGQAPFLTLLLHFEEDYEYAYEASIIQEEILKQRLQGIKNEDGQWSTPAFPKLIYVLDEHNIHKDSKYYYLSELAAKCTAKRMYPDYISAKQMKKIYEGNIFAPIDKLVA